jgi:hypothetical protein
MRAKSTFDDGIRDRSLRHLYYTVIILWSLRRKMERGKLGVVVYGLPVVAIEITFPNRFDVASLTCETEYIISKRRRSIAASHPVNYPADVDVSPIDPHSAIHPNGVTAASRADIATFAMSDARCLSGGTNGEMQSGSFMFACFRTQINAASKNCRPQ